MGVAMDVADEQQVDAATAKVVKAFGGLGLSSSAMRASRLSRRRRLRIRQVEATPVDPSGRRLPDHARRAASDVQAEERLHHLHGLVTRRKRPSQGALRHAEAR